MQDDSFDGFGMYKSASGSSYSGQYRNGAKHGRGVSLSLFKLDLCEIT